MLSARLSILAPLPSGLLLRFNIADAVAHHIFEILFQAAADSSAFTHLKFLLAERAISLTLVSDYRYQHGEPHRGGENHKQHNQGPVLHYPVHISSE
jgi:hypothetical protein